VAEWRRDPKVVGIKSAHAYGRSLAFQKVDASTAEKVFNQILTHEGHTLSPHEALPLQDYLMFQLVARADAAGLPMVFHTGLQAGNYNRIANANPLHLQPLLEEFPRAKIDLFHAGMPWVREIAVLAKYFPGVRLNMAWTHIINPAQARAALSEWLDMVPNTKIFGFGGDYAIVEKVYGHLKLARQDVAMVLAEKVREGAFSRKEASMVALRLMRENAEQFYGLTCK
jgi:predicted TIM-barrel fold metal-dependent hydrolase